MTATTTTRASTPPAVRTTLRRLVTRPAWAVHAAVAVPFALGVSVPEAVAYLPFVASILVLGLPHGAVDHLAVARSRGVTLPAGLAGLLAPASRDAVVRVVVLYVVLGGAYLGAWLVAPVASFAFFVALTWFHWGQGDLYALVDLAAETHLRTRLQRALAVVVRGGLPMLVPLVGGPGEYRQVAEAVVALFGREPAALAPVFRADVRLALGAAFAAVCALALALGAVRARETGTLAAWRVDAVETVLLWGYFLVVPPIVAVGLYFCLWHSVRHIARLVAVDGPARASLARGETVAAVARFARDAAPMTAGALVVLVGLYALVPAEASLPGLVAVYLVLLAVLTLPHAVVVTAMDRAQGVWTPGPGTWE